MQLSAPSEHLRLRQIADSVHSLIVNLDKIRLCLPTLDKEVAFAKDKAIAEIGLFLIEVVTSEVPKPLRQKCLDELESLIEICDFRRIQSLVYCRPQAALAFGTVGLALQAIGRIDHPMYETLQTAIASPFYLATSRPEFRELEAYWLARRMQSIAAPLIPNKPLTGILFRQTHPVFLRREDIYAKTHAAMYMTDFGRNAIDGNFNQQRVLQGLNHDMAWAYVYADWDLVGELLMSSYYVSPRTHTSWQKICDDSLDAIYDKFGCIPTPGFNGVYADTLSKSDRNHYLLFQSYHTTIVYGLLLLARQRRQIFTETDCRSTDLEEFLRSAFENGCFELTGSGLDENWFILDADLSLPSDFVADLILMNVYERAGAEIALALIDRIDEAIVTIPLRETIVILEKQSALHSRFIHISAGAHTPI
jgi:hypothetical protein